MALQKFRDLSPDLATLQQLSANGPLAVEIMRFAGPGVPYEHIAKQEGLTPEIVQNIYPWVQANFGGGKPYRFKTYVPAAPGISPIEWERSIPGLPKQPDSSAAAMTQQQWTANPQLPSYGGMQGGGMAPQMMGPQFQTPGAMPYGQQPPPYGLYVDGGAARWGTPWSVQPPWSMPPQAWGMTPPWMMQPPQQSSGGNDLERRLGEERHLREMERMEAKGREDREILMRRLEENERKREEEKKEAALLVALRSLQESLTNRKPDDSSTSWGAVVSSVLSSIAQSNATAAEQVRLAATSAIDAANSAAARGQQQSPHLELLMKHVLEQSSPKAMAEMAATASTIAQDSIQMMATAAEKMGESSGNDKQIWQAVIEQVSRTAQAFMGATAQKTNGHGLGSAEATLLPEGESFGELNPFIKNMRDTIAAGKMPPEKGAELFADLLYRFHMWGVGSVTILAKDFMTKPLETAKRVLRVDDDYCQKFCAALPDAAKKAGFTPEDFGAAIPAQAPAPTPSEAQDVSKN